MVDIDQKELGKKDLNINIKVKSDAKYFLEKLFKYMKKIQKKF